MPWWGGLIIGIGFLVIGGVLGFLITKKIVQKQLRDNPPITEKQIRAMYMQMGRKPSEADIKKVMNSMKRAK
ncbi:YneF family protein [Spiroplasma endosymbiont of Megaselia nigra]|uniref:YneF family protein n=1 Tax=Spiroplasma endosymbiont of Megaselia nigra TaxID=2478537 RepID=UPI000F899BCB|nr:YneF family protein [Spiroplasma endosymbiont of Megaselia nigra]RUO85949.1 YneF family protein [Spiroplasma endosymbiont of Megaselia nigra]